jgi:hypothetical protein
MTQQTIDHIRAVLEFYAETSSGKEPENAKTNTMALIELARLESNKGYFPIAHVHRHDLEGVGFDVSKVDDGTMQELAEKMGEAYTESVFWIDLPIIAEHLEIPTKNDNERDSA